MAKIKTAKFFMELILLSIFSIVSASLWAEWIKGTIARNSSNQPMVMFFVAIAVTVVGIGLMYYFFAQSGSNDRLPNEKEIIVQ